MRRGAIIATSAVMTKIAIEKCSQCDFIEIYGSRGNVEIWCCNNYDECENVLCPACRKVSDGSCHRCCDDS